MGNVEYTDHTAAPSALDNVDSGSLLSELLAVETKLETKTIKLEVSTRPGWVVEFDNTVTGSQLKRYTEFATNGDDVDRALLNAFLLGDHNRGIYLKTEQGLQRVPDKGGKPLTFRSLEFVHKFSSPDNPDRSDAIIAFLGEPQTLAMGDKVGKFSGWNDKAVEVAEQDPSIG